MMMSSIRPRAFISVPTAIEVAVVLAVEAGGGPAGDTLARASRLTEHHDGDQQWGIDHHVELGVEAGEREEHRQQEDHGEWLDFLAQAGGERPARHRDAEDESAEHRVHADQVGVPGARQNKLRIAAIIDWETPPAFSAMRPSPASHLRPMVGPGCRKSPRRRWPRFPRRWSIRRWTGCEAPKVASTTASTHQAAASSMAPAASARVPSGVPESPRSEMIRASIGKAVMAIAAPRNKRAFKVADFRREDAGHVLQPQDQQGPQDERHHHAGHRDAGRAAGACRGSGRC